MLAYVKSRKDEGTTATDIIESFHVEKSWLSNWIETNVSSSNDPSATGPATDQATDAGALSAASLAAMLESWVAERRIVAEAEELCVAALEGCDAEAIAQILASGTPWDAEVGSWSWRRSLFGLVWRFVCAGGCLLFFNGALGPVRCHRGRIRPSRGPRGGIPRPRRCGGTRLGGTHGPVRAARQR